ncbi:MAG TPA: cytochrome c oxidase subunit II [Polyangia bacterium]|jgi:cytochrome c oxidase subunit 2
MTRALRLLAALPLLAVGGCGMDWLVPTRASTVAPAVDHLFFLLLGISGFFVVVIAGLVLTYIVRYREGTTTSRVDRLKRRWVLEATWIGIPSLMALGIFVWAAFQYVDMTSAPAGSRTVYAVGKQWMWKFRHQDGREEINTLHVPLGEPVRMVMFSQDVVHSFFVPAFRIKQDLVPGRFTTTWFQATRPGTYLLECAQYCGHGHSDMRGEIIVMSPADFARWAGPGAPGGGAVAGTPGTPGAELAVAGSMAGRGRNAFFRYGCNACHLPTADVRAPRLDGIFGRPVRFRNGQQAIADEQYIRESILDPQAKIAAGYPAPSLMPTYRGQIGEADIQDIIEFIKSIRHGWPRGAASQPAGAAPASRPAQEQQE